MLIEKFIRKFFKSETCLLQKLNGEWVPGVHATKLLLTSEQIEKEYGAEGLERRSTASQLKSKLGLVREALTAPSACRDYDYERLEFYGDSIIGFLVILELFLLNQSNTEGDLDFRRIERVSNENFYKINKQNQFYKYMIIDPHYVFSGFTPAGFDQFEAYCHSSLHYQNKVTQKTYNELNNRLKGLKIIQERLLHSNEPDDLKQMFMRGDIYSLARIILKDDQMVQKIAFRLTQSTKITHTVEHPRTQPAPNCSCQKLRSEFESLLYK